MNPKYTVSLDNEPWEFYYAGIWERDNGFYISTDSGCSCPIPWENHSEDSLTGPLTWDQVKEELRSLAGVSRKDNYASDQVEKFIAKKENN